MRYQILGLLLLTSCTIPTANATEETGDPEMNPNKNLINAYTTELFATTNALGSFAGPRLANLQQTELEPGEYTIQFQVVESSVEGVPGAGPKLGFSTYALISWKIAGQQLQRIISVFNGSAITGVADSVHVQLLDQSDRGLSQLGSFNVTNGLATFTTGTPYILRPGSQIQFTSQPGVYYNLVSMNGTAGILSSVYTGPTTIGTNAIISSRYKIAGTLSKGTRATTMQPPILVTGYPVGINPFPDQGVVPIPTTEAGIISILATPVLTGNSVQTGIDNVQVLFTNSTGIPLNAYLPTKFAGWFPIPPGTANVIFQNGNAAGGAVVGYQWGIEG